VAEVTRETVETANRQSRRLRELLHAPEILVMPGAYDALSVRLFESMGFAAIQGSSGAIAAIHGLYDEDLMGLDRTAEAYREIVEAVAVPVNADGEKGYGRAEDMQRTITELVRVGLAGMNIEDSAPHAHGASTTLVPLDEQLAKLNAIAAAKHVLGSEFFINARVDVFGTVSEHAAGMDEVIRRGNAYAEAGADCIFIFRPGDAATIGTLVREIQAPLSVLANETTPAIPELEQLGVARVSYGSSFGRLAISAVRELAAVLAARGDPAPLLRGGLQRAELQALLRGE